MTEPTQYEFYAPWPLFGKKLSNQWGESRQNSEVLAALVQAAGLDLDDPLKNSDLMSWELGQLDFHNRFRFIYDDVNTSLKIQKNTGTESVPIWVTALTIDYETSLLTVNGDTSGFYLGINRVELFGLNKIQPDSFYNVKTLYFSSDDGFYFTTGPSGNPVVRLSDRVTGGGGGAGISSIDVRSTVSSPTYATDTVIFDKDDFYISSSSTGKPIISLNTDPTSGGISSITVQTTVPLPAFSTGTILFDRSDFYLSPNSLGYPIVSLAAEDVDTTALTVKTTVPLPTFSTDTLIFDRSDFYISPNSQGEPVVSIAFEDVDTTSVLVKTTDLGGTFTPSDFNTDKIIFNRSDFYITPDSQGKPIVNIAQTPATNFGDATIVSGVQSQTFTSSVEWIFQHNLNARPLLWGIYDNGYEAILPDKLDVSNPNVAYFYFSEATAGTAIVSTGHTSADVTIRDTTPYDSYDNIKTISFHSDDFYITQNATTDEAIVNSKQNTRVIVGDNVNKSYVTNKIGFNSGNFYITPDSGNKPVINLVTPQRSFILVALSADQTTNIASLDHVKFDRVIAKTGDKITLDTTSSYTTGTGASIGRFTLAPNTSYKLEAFLGVAFSATPGSLIRYFWANESNTILNGAFFFANQIAGASGSLSSDQPAALGFAGSGSDPMLVEVAIFTPANLSSITALYSFAMITEI